MPQGLKPSLAAAVCGTAEAVPFVERGFPIQLSTDRFAKTLSPYCNSGAARPAIFDIQPDFGKRVHDTSLPNQVKATDPTNTLIWTAL